MRSGHCGVGPITRFSTDGYRSGVGAEVARERCAALESLRARLGLPSARRLAWVAELSQWALAEAMLQSGIARADLGGPRTGVVVAGSTAGMVEGEGTILDRRAGEPWPRAADSLALLRTPVASTLDAVVAWTRAQGPATFVSTACSSSTHALAQAVRWIRQGRCDRVVVGGADGLCRLTHAGFNALSLVDPERPRPFDADRQGMVIGEGAAFFIVESEETLGARGGEPRGWILGGGAACDGWHIVQPKPDGSGAALSMRRALADAGLDPEQIGYINAHGTGTAHNDVAEARAVHSVFGARAAGLPVSSSKSQLGHLLGASGAAEAAMVLIAMAEEVLPPTVGLRTLDPEVQLDVVPDAGRRARPAFALSNSFAFGGNNASVVLARADAWGAGS